MEDEKSTEGRECANCPEEREDGGLWKNRCTCCNRRICDGCVEYGLIPYVWFEISHWCSVCNGLMCWECSVVCYDCANESLSTLKEFCSRCAPADIVETNCPVHPQWTTCSKHQHPRGQCGECYGN